MPDWNDPKYSAMKELIERFIASMNDRDYPTLESCFSDDIVMAREDIFQGKVQVIGWYKKIFSRQAHEAIKFELLDASGGLFNEDEAQVILYTEIHQNGAVKELFIESMNLRKVDQHWVILKLFGLSYEPESHKKFFKKFL